MAYANGYNHRRTITIDKSKIGGSLTNFPMLFAGTYSYLATSANGGEVLSSGNDIIFTDTSDTVLDYEKVDYEATTGKVEYWIKIPTIYGSVNKVIYMYYGKSSATDSSNPTGVWDTARYAAVYHMKGSSNGNDTDSTSNGYTLATTGTVGSSTTAKIGSTSRDTGGTAGNYLSTNDAANLDGMTKLGIQAWVRDTANDANPRGIVGKRSSSSSQHSYGLFLFTSRFINFDTGNSTGTNFDTRLATLSAIPANTWTKVDAFFDGTLGTATRKTIFLNGVLNVTGSATTTSIYNGTAPLTTHQLGSGTFSWSGQIDEVRILKDVLSAEWLTTEYNNQNDPSTFYAVGAEDVNTFSNGYQKRRLLSIDYTKVSGGATLTDYPALVSITDNDFKDIPNGGNMFNSQYKDIRFETTGGVALDYELEFYSASTGQIIAHVRIPSLSHTANTQFYMYYGKPSLATVEDNSTGVWNSNYRAVYHLSQAPSISVQDSTSNVRNMTPSNMESGDLIDGQIYKGLDFDKTNEYTSVADSGAGDNLRMGGNTQWTVQAWIKTDNNAQDEQYVVAKFKWGGPTGYAILARSSGRVGIKLNGSAHSYVSANNVIDTTNKFLLHGMMTSGTNLKMFVNGTQVINQTISSTSLSAATDVPFTVGCASDALGNAAYAYDGLIDEVRVLNVALTQGWCVTEYNNHSSPSTFMSVSSAQVPSATYTKTLSMRARIKKLAITKTLSMKARVKGSGITKTLSMRARIRKLAITKTLSMRARIKKLAITKTISMRARIKNVGITKTFSMRASIISAPNKTFTMRARIKKADTTKTLSMMARIKGSGIVKNLSMLARIKNTQNKTLSMLARIKHINITKTISMRARINKVITKTLSMQARVKQAGITKTFSMRARVLGSGTLKSLYMLARVKHIDITKTFSARARVKHVDTTKTFTIMARIKHITTRNLSMMARVKHEGVTKTFSARARIVSSGLVKNLSMRARIQQLGVQKTLSMMTRVKHEAITKTFSMRAYIEHLKIQTFSMRARILRVQEASFTMRARIKGTGIVKTLSMMARVEHADVEKTMSMRARIQKEGITKVLTMMARIKQVAITKTLSMKARVKKLNIEKTFSMQARIKKTGIIKTFAMKARINVSGTMKTFTTLARIKQAGITKTMSMRANIKNVVTKNFSMKARVKTTDITKTFSMRARIRRSNGTLDRLIPSTVRENSSNTGLKQSIIISNQQ